MELIFSKLLTQTDIQIRLSVPTRILCLLPFDDGDTSHRHADLRVKDGGGHIWTFRCIWRDGVYAKPVFSKGWLEFVYAKNLKIHDKVDFYVERDVDEAAVVAYTIEVRRNILRLMGRDIWIEVEYLHYYGLA